jgi:putative copper export protein
MLPVTAATIRLFLHVLGATVWVGGQITLAGLVPGLRTLGPEAGPEATRAAARRFNLIAWPAFALLVVTGVWNIAAEHPTFGTAYTTTLMVKIVVVAASGITALVHTQAKSRMMLAVFGALTGITALAALFLGIMLATG